MSKVTGINRPDPKPVIKVVLTSESKEDLKSIVRNYEFVLFKIKIENVK